MRRWEIPIPIDHFYSAHLFLLPGFSCFLLFWSLPFYFLCSFRCLLAHGFFTTYLSKKNHSRSRTHSVSADFSIIHECLNTIRCSFYLVQRWISSVQILSFDSHLRIEHKSMDTRKRHLPAHLSANTITKMWYRWCVRSILIEGSTNLFQSALEIVRNYWNICLSLPLQSNFKQANLLLKPQIVEDYNRDQTGNWLLIEWTE